jgi:hypothetical protein
VAWKRVSFKEIGLGWLTLVGILRAI